MKQKGSMAEGEVASTKRIIVKVQNKVANLDKLPSVPCQDTVNEKDKLAEKGSAEISCLTDKNSNTSLQKLMIPDTTELTEREEWQGWKIVSDMLDNPDKNGIYPTSKCYKELYEFIVTQKEKAVSSLKAELKQQLAEKDKEIKFLQGYKEFVENEGKEVKKQ